MLPKSDAVHVREVWKDNLEEEFCFIRDIIDNYPYIALDTEFPGVVIEPEGDLSPYEFMYKKLKDNVDSMKLIQVGLTFTDKNGNLPNISNDGYCIWQFNLCEFNMHVDIFAKDSIELLNRSGINFKKNKEEGVELKRFAELLMSSGAVLNECTEWVTFHGGYDFGYLLKSLTCKPLPETLTEFFKLLKMFFPKVYDIKHLIKFCDVELHGGLNRVAESLEVERIGIAHQAGSDSLVTSRVFKKLKEEYNFEQHEGVLYGFERR